MSVLIEELKKDHSEIVAVLNEVKELGILSKEGQAKLLSAKEHLLTHLNKEDEQLYPLLRKKAEKNKQLKNALDLCAIDMENVSRVVQGFFDKYSRGVIPDTELQKEFENLFVALGKRISNEEDILYDEYEWVNQ
ncbi:MAG: hemerythrin domain-containing protein [Candidatus Scalinduaceae bacterium]